MNETPYHQFIDLVRCDDQITACLRSQERFKKDLSALEQEKIANNRAFEQQQDAVRGMKKGLDAQELELSSARQKKLSIEKKLALVSGAKEYESLSHEQKQIDRIIETLEETIISAWEPYEKAKLALVKHEADYSNKAADLVAREKKLQQHIDTLEETIGFLRRERVQKASWVRKDWLENYEALRQNSQNPVVEIQSGACSGCFNKVTSQLEVRIARHELVTCPMCRRILYQV